MSTRPSYLTDFYATFAGPDGMTIALLRRDGAVLARYPAGDATAAFPPDDPLIAVASKTASGVVTLYSPHYRQTRLAGFAQVADSDLVVTYALSRDGVLAPWRSDLLRYGLLTALGSLALATMTGIAMVNAHRVAAARRHLETINAALAQEVADRLRIEAELRELNRHLEARVASRTASLADIAIQRGQEVTFLAAVLEASPYAELVIDTGGTIILVNAAAERLLGYRREALIGQGVDVLVPETLRGGHVALRKAFMEAPVGRAMGEGLELLGRRQDGTPVPVEILLAPLQTRDGMAVIVGIADISARKQHEAALTQANVELRAANQDLRQANAVSQHRREEVEAFVHIISHDLRTPLITLQGFSREMELGGAELRRMVAALDLPAETGLALRNLVEQDIDSPLKYIRASIRRFDRLINSLLELSRTGRFPLQNEPLQVGAIVAAILEALQQAALAAGARVEVGSLPDATGDGGAVGQIFANLIENSLKYTDPKREPRIEIGGETDGTMVRYWVRDNGVGIPDGARARLFQVFQRFHPKLADGDGIGLASVRRLVERHGGTVWADSEVGTGTTFYFTLPAMPRQEASS
jgi:PAS domain S-box-containing protein